ncbi:amidohydrolase family protein [SAR202 cluster bacterium AD-804-J14_MRT_500m]|nr:amidohydrolase family protein [SAR202 cluster bacterium AD-804-J14_MRT_500m]
MGQSTDVLIKGGLLVSGDGITRSDILVKDGRVNEVGLDLPIAGARVVDVAGKYVLPGGIDSHAHPIFADKMDTYSICAAYGGVTTIVAFIGSETHRHQMYGNAWGDRTYNPDIVKGFIEYATDTSYTDFAIHGFITIRDQHDVDKVVPELIRMGVISFKMFMTWNPWVRDHSSNDISVPDEVLMQVMDLAARDGGMPMVHAENGCCKGYLEGQFRSQGNVGRQFHLPSAPSLLEAEAVNRAATMATIVGAPLYPVHLSSKDVVPVLDQYKQKGLPIFAETCPHYLTLTDADLLDRGYTLKVSPPLRQHEDQDAMWRGLSSGIINTIGSDFTGYTRSLKLTGRLDGQGVEPDSDSENIFDIAAGLTTLEFMMPVVWTHGVNTGKITLPRFVQLFCENPAKIFGIYPQKGSLNVGSDADLVIWDQTRTHTVDEEHGKSDLSTFKGMNLLGMPILTMVRGQVVIEEGKLVGRKGSAEFVAGNPNSAAYAPKGPSAD